MAVLPYVLLRPWHWEEPYGRAAIHSHLCTLPEELWEEVRLLPRAEVAERLKEEGFRVVLYPKCIRCGEGYPGEFMVHNRIWKEAGLGMGTIHLACLETCLGRPLTVKDFKENLPINEPLIFGYELGRKK